MKVSRNTAITRLRRDCIKNEEILYISRSIQAENEFGECYIADGRNNSVVDSGTIQEVMERRSLLRKDEEIL